MEALLGVTLGGQGAAEPSGGQRAPGRSQEKVSEKLWIQIRPLVLCGLSLTVGGKVPDGAMETLGCEACRGPRSIIICLLAMSLLDCEPLELNNCVSFMSGSPEPITMPCIQRLLADVC